MTPKETEADNDKNGSPYLGPQIGVTTDPLYIHGEDARSMMSRACLWYFSLYALTAELLEGKEQARSLQSCYSFLLLLFCSFQ